MQNQLRNPNHSVFSSTAFKFLVGPNKKPYTVHSALIAYHSKPLGVLVNGEMLEAKEGCAFLEDTDERTFLLFSQYAYTGDYATVDPKMVSNASAITTNEVLPGPVEGGTVQTHSTTKVDLESIPIPKDVSGFGSGLQSEKKKSYINSRPPPWHWVPREIRGNHTEAIFEHARLYVFAEKYDIGPLKCLSLQKLHEALNYFALRKPTAETIVNLIQYSYSNTMDLSGSVDALRLLVISYAAYKVRYLVQNAAFLSLLEQPGPAAKDLTMELIEKMDRA